MSFWKKPNIDWQITSVIEKITIILLLAFGMIYNYDPVHEFVQKKVFHDATDSGIMITFFSTFTAALVGILFSIGNKASDLKKALEDSKLGLDSKLFYKGTLGIYEDVEKEIIALKNAGEHIEIDILGFTLFSVKNKFATWKENNEISNMTINLFYLDPEYIKGNPHINDTWEANVKSYVRTIERFISTSQDYLTTKKIKINLYPFKHIPAVHGFKLHGRSIFISIATWDNGILHDPQDQSTYIKIQNGDVTNSATYLRRLFDNWVKKAKEQIT